MKEYYDARAQEYDDWYLGTALHADRDRPGWKEELERLIEVISELPTARTLDVACGTGFLTRHLRGDVVGIDQSASMLEVAARQAPEVTFVQGDGLGLPFPDSSFERVFTGHFYGHLEAGDRERFVSEARRVAPTLVVVDASLGHSSVADEWQERVLNDGSQWEVYKRYFTGTGLADELGAGRVLFDGRYFVVVES